MNKKDKLFECYDFNDEVYLIETVIDDSSDNIDWGEFTVPEKNAPESDWQVAYAEQNKRVQSSSSLSNSIQLYKNH